MLFCATFAFLLGLLFMRLLRQEHCRRTQSFGHGARPSLETLPLHLYNTVIQQLKQQKHELQVQSQAEQHRARTRKISARRCFPIFPAECWCSARTGWSRQPIRRRRRFWVSLRPPEWERKIFSAERSSVPAVRQQSGDVGEDERRRSRRAWRTRSAQCCAKTASGGKLKPSTKLRRAKSDSSRSRFLRCRGGWQFARRRLPDQRPAANWKRSAASRNCTARSRPRWRCNCARRWPRFPATRSNLPTAAIRNWRSNWRPTSRTKPRNWTAALADF